MIYPGYQLNPGDMFQVEPERVLFATGAAKTRTTQRRRRDRARKARMVAKTPTKIKPTKVGPVGSSTVPEVIESRDTSPEALRERLQDLMTQTKKLLEKKEGVRAGVKAQLREFRTAVKRAISLHKSATDLSTETLEGQLALIKERHAPAAEATSEDVSLISSAFEFAEENTLERASLNRHDTTKPYATPWRPRPYMSAFAFIPRYLEVNQNICAAVYLRHPVARPGFSEVPSPFSQDTNQLAFNWYLKRR